MSLEAASRALIELYPRLIESLEAGSGGPFVAGIVLDGKIAGWGANSVLRDHDVTRHAEMNALSDAGGRLGRIRLDRAILVTSHLPCLMCYHAAKWATIHEVYYVFDYVETERIFGFRGDARFLEDLGMEPGAVERDASLRLLRVRDPGVDALYRSELPRLWDSSYRARCAAYDV